MRERMKVLFIVSGNHGSVTPIIKNQGDAMAAEEVEVEYYLIRGKGVGGYLRNVKPFMRFLRTYQYDAIHAHYSLSAFVASLAGAKPLVVSLMGSDVKASGWYKVIIRLFALLFRWRAIIVKSNDMYRDLSIKRAFVIPNGVNMERFKPLDKAECQKRLGWKITNEKLQTTNHKSQTTNMVKHILFPANASRPEKDYALAKSACALFENVELHAFDNTPNEETPYWYNAADVVLLTSKWEGSPNAIKEAMACGCPIVSVDVGDVAERMSGVDGCHVVPTREPKDIAEALEKALTFNGKTKGRERIIADGLTNEMVAEKIVRIYKQVKR